MAKELEVCAPRNVVKLAGLGPLLVSDILELVLEKKLRWGREQLGVFSEKRRKTLYLDPS